MTHPSARALWQEYLIRIGADDMYRREPVFYAQWNFLRETLERIEVVLQDEHLPPDQVERILRSILYGGPSKSDAERRLETIQQMKDLAARTPEPLLRERLGRWP
ncbi:hypothetical protein J5X84_36250 [Streptosporangiaceae bacterium NEAU-GS5]|nr:hypothetical protein [Streptosporangiaceae bacterium NEAU-GS5]